MPEIKIVIDINVLISGLLWEGIPHQIVELAERGAIAIYTTILILEEMKDVLARDKFSKRMATLNTSMAEIFESLLSLVKVITEPEIKPVIKDDPDDDKVIACALASKSDYIVSGDFHLLELISYEGIPIVNPKEFWEKVGKDLGRGEIV